MNRKCTLGKSDTAKIVDGLTPAKFIDEQLQEQKDRRLEEFIKSIVGSKIKGAWVEVEQEVVGLTFDNGAYMDIYKVGGFGKIE